MQRPTSDDLIKRFADPETTEEKRKLYEDLKNADLNSADSVISAVLSRGPSRAEILAPVASNLSRDVSQARGAQENMRP